MKLKQEEFLKLELNHAKSDLVNREKVIIALKKELNITKKQLLTYAHKEMDAELSELNKAMETLMTAETRNKNERTTDIEKVKKRLKIKGRFGYDPDTLTVIEE